VTPPAPDPARDNRCRDIRLVSNRFILLIFSAENGVQNFTFLVSIMSTAESGSKLSEIGFIG